MGLVGQQANDVLWWCVHPPINCHTHTRTHRAGCSALTVHHPICVTRLHQGSTREGSMVVRRFEWRPPPPPSYVPPTHRQAQAHLHTQEHHSPAPGSQAEELVLGPRLAGAQPHGARPRPVSRPPPPPLLPPSSPSCGIPGQASAAGCRWPPPPGTSCSKPHACGSRTARRFCMHARAPRGASQTRPGTRSTPRGVALVVLQAQGMPCAGRAHCCAQTCRVAVRAPPPLPPHAAALPPICACACHGAGGTTVCCGWQSWSASPSTSMWQRAARRDDQNVDAPALPCSIMCCVVGGRR